MLYINSILYVVAFLATALTGYVVIVGVLVTVMEKRLNKKQHEDDDESDPPEVTEKIWHYGANYDLYCPPIYIPLPKFFNPLLLVIAIFLLFSSYYLLAEFSYYPPFFVSQTYIEEQERKAKLKAIALSNEAKEVYNALSNIEELSQNEIKNVLTNTYVFLDRLEKETIEKEENLSNIRKQINMALKQRQDEEGKSDILTDENNRKLLALYIDAQGSSLKYLSPQFWIDILIAFVLGVAASMVAPSIPRLILKWRSDPKPE